jgi:hypothetical protein
MEPRVQGGRAIAYKNTSVRRLHFPESLLQALKQNEIKWRTKPHSEGVVFVLLRQEGETIVDIRVFSTLSDATGDALYAVVHEYPEMFALRREQDLDAGEDKHQKTENATDVIKQVTARPQFEVVEAGPAADNDNPTGTQGTAFVLKPEDPEQQQVPRVPKTRPDFANDEVMMLDDDEEPPYVFWGQYRIASFGLKMEAKRNDGTTVKISVHLKNLRKPVHH